MKILLLSLFLFVGITVIAQTSFEKAMTEKVAQVEQQKTSDEFTALANDFKKKCFDWLK